MQLLEIALGVITNRQGEVLIARRHAGQHQGNLWEFPGGKLDAGETPCQALTRELSEELGIEVVVARQLIRIPHNYPDRQVVLHVWLVSDFNGHPVGRESQPLCWVAARALNPAEFPAANAPIIRAIQLPAYYLITPDPGTCDNWSRFLQQFDQSLARGITLVQLRAHSLNDEQYAWLATELLARVRKAGGQLLLNRPATEPWLSLADGVHLTRHQLAKLERRPAGECGLIAASCHDEDELLLAERLGLDFALLSPVTPTDSHPGAETLGWARFADMVRPRTLPVYALGGVSPAQLPLAWEQGAQGIAAIGSLWGEGAPVAGHCFSPGRAGS